MLCVVFVAMADHHKGHSRTKQYIHCVWNGIDFPKNECKNRPGEYIMNFKCANGSASHTKKSDTVEFNGGLIVFHCGNMIFHISHIPFEMD